MVWGLFPVDPLSGEDKYYIFKTGIYKVGRKGCDVIITKDKGVSRVHAEIIVNTMNLVNPLPDEHSHLSPGIHIRDSSKYGTFISKNVGPKKKVHELPNKETALEDGDLVSFGTGTATYKFCHVPLSFFICSSNKVDESLEEKISSIGASITHTLGEECTHVLVDQLMPLTKDLVDAVVSKKSCVLKTWLEFFAEKNIGTEVPSCHSYIPTVSAEGESIKVADPRTREDCLKGYTFLFESDHLYKFGDQLKSLLEVAGAKVVSFEEFCSNSLGSDGGEKNRVVCVIPGGPASASKSNLFNKLSSLLRVNEMDVICAAFSGQLDLSILKSPCILVSSSCSTDETVVADSDTEVETATSARSNEALSNGNNVKHDKTEELYVDSDTLDKRKHEGIEASPDDVSTRLHDIKRAKTEASLDGSSVGSHATSFRNDDGGIKEKKDKDAYQARLEEVTSQVASTPGSQPPDVTHKMQIWREVSRGVTHGRCYGTADLSANVRHHAPTLTQESSAPSQSSRSAMSAETRAARAREVVARAREDAARAREDAARANQQLDEILARLTSIEQGASFAPSAPAPPPPPSGHGHADYENEFDPNYTMLDSDDPLFR